MQITLQKTSVNDVEQLFFMETSVAAYRRPNIFPAREFELVIDRLSVCPPNVKSVIWYIIFH